MALIGILAASSGAAWAQVPALRALQGFQAGQWQSKSLGNGGDVQSQCLPNVETMLIGSRAAPQCVFTTISDEEDGAVVTYRCASGRSGRTAIRRDTAGIFVIDAQGLEAGLPFASRTEWRRTGSC